jgi:hypothetical protein
MVIFIIRLYKVVYVAFSTELMAIEKKSSGKNNPRQRFFSISINSPN